MIALKVQKIGDSVAVVLPKEVLARLKIGEGDTLFLTEAPDGFRLTPHDSDFETQMAVARRIMEKRRDLLRELAKR